LKMCRVCVWLKIKASPVCLLLLLGSEARSSRETACLLCGCGVRPGQLMSSCWCVPEAGAYTKAMQGQAGCSAHKPEQMEGPVGEQAVLAHSSCSKLLQSTSSPWNSSRPFPSTKLCDQALSPKLSGTLTLLQALSSQSTLNTTTQSSGACHHNADRWCRCLQPNS
jgi:hypothetical protein